MRHALFCAFVTLSSVALARDAAERPSSSSSGVSGVDFRYYRDNNTDAVSLTTSVTSQPPAWNQIGLDIDGDINEGRLGRSVSLSDDGLTVAIGGSKQVQIHRWNGNTWVQRGDDIDAEATSLAADIEANYPAERLRKLVESGGLDCD